MIIPNGYMIETKKGLKMYLYGKWFTYNPKDKRINRKILRKIDRMKK
jgi:uridine kinase